VCSVAHYVIIATMKGILPAFSLSWFSEIFTMIMLVTAERINERVMLSVKDNTHACIKDLQL
jgi:hypothetical protein